MGRLVIAVALIVALDASGALSPQPACDPDTPVPCYTAVAEATSALPNGHASIAFARVYNPQLHCWFCPLFSKQTALLIFYPADHTSAFVSVWVQDAQVRTAYEGADTWR